MKITAIEIRDFKRLREIDLRPSADTYLILLGGDNAQGKTSILDALTAAFGGGRAIPADPIRHGAERAEIRIELDGGDMVVRRRISEDGETLELRDADGADVRRPQERLKALVGSSFLDPMEFLSRKEADQRADLLKTIKDADTIVALDAQHGALYTKRTEVNRDLKKAEGEFARLPVVDQIETVDVDDLYRQIGELRASGLAREQGARRIATARAQLERAKAEHDRAIAEMLAAEARVTEARDELGVATVALESVKGDGSEHRLEALQARANEATEINRRATEQRVAAERRAKAKAEVEQLRERSEKLSAALEKIDADKTAALEAAELPVAGLGFNADGVTFNGVPLAQASGAERLRVALALAIATRPKLREVWIRDGALLDEQSLALVADQARKAGCRVWIERVGDRDPGAIIVSDGKIAGPRIVR